MSILDSGVNNLFAKRTIIGALMVPFALTVMLAVFVPQPGEPERLQDEIDDLMKGYTDMTGQSPISEEVWGLAGIYTPYGTDQEGKRSTQYGITDDGWVYGQRIQAYAPSQYGQHYTDGHWEKDQGYIDYGELGYAVTHDPDTGLYYYAFHGDDLSGISDTHTEDDKVVKGSLYTRVHMDNKQKSEIFITTGGKHAMDNGTFYYEYTGYRYSFVPLQDYHYSKSLDIQAKTSSCSLIWYQYTVDSGIQGQLVISGSDSGVAYITGQQITRAFDQATSSAKFTMSFNNVDVYVYIMLDPYQIQHGMSPEVCYNNGYWSVMLTTPKYVQSGGDGMSLSFDVDHLVDTIIGLLTFDGSVYGLEGDQGIIASVVFAVSFYASLIALGLSFWPILVLQGLIAQIQAQVSWWPF